MEKLKYTKYYILPTVWDVRLGADMEFVTNFTRTRFFNNLFSQKMRKLQDRKSNAGQKYNFKQGCCTLGKIVFFIYGLANRGTIAQGSNTHK